MHCQLEHQDLCRWLGLLKDIEINRIEIAHPGAIEKITPLAKRINPERRRSNQRK
jgi:isopropylmalate/homocitrate/citramalate synthase